MASGGIVAVRLTRKPARSHFAMRIEEFLRDTAA